MKAVKQVSNYLKQYGGYLSPIVFVILVGFLATVEQGGLKYYSGHMSRFLPNWYHNVGALSINAFVIAAIISGLFGALLFDKYFSKKIVKSKALNQVVGFILFFSVIPILIFIIGGLLGVIWIV